MTSNAQVFIKDSNPVPRCCGNQITLRYKIKTPQGDQIFLLCEEHSQLEYFRKYKIEEIIP